MLHANPHPSITARLRDRLGAFSDPVMLYFLLALLPVELVIFQCLGPMPIYLVEQRHMPASLYGLLFTINTILIIFTEVPLNLAMTRWSHRSALALGAFLYSVGFGAMAFVGTFAPVALTVVIWTIGEMILMPGSSAYVAEIAPVARRGEYMGVYTMSFSLALAIAPWIGAHVLESFGARTLWIGCFGLGCISVLLLSRLGARTRATLVETTAA